MLGIIAAIAAVILLLGWVIIYLTIPTSVGLTILGLVVVFFVSRSALAVYQQADEGQKVEKWQHGKTRSRRTIFRNLGSRFGHLRYEIGWWCDHH